jgi:hypothetical protein
VKCYNGIDLSLRLRIPYNLCAFNLYQHNPSVDVSMFLASDTSSDKLFYILVHHWPEESTLLDLGMCTKYSIVSSIG